jgi:DNA invertase Pin-like site-specific DNA recombinase
VNFLALTVEATMPARRIGISYRRFSDKYKQSKGDSEDRQERDFRNFCRRHNLTPFTQDYTDRGRSGYHDAHRKKGRLGHLIAAAKDGRFEPRSVIVIEAWDRLGRLRPDKQTDLIAELLRTGVDIGICRLDDIFTEEDFGTHKWTTLAVFVQLAYQESKQKAERIGASWMRRREKAREEGRIMTAQIPAWLEIVNGEIVPIPERVAALKRIFELSGAGKGKSRICRALTVENVQPFGLSGKWTVPYIAKILTDRRVLGEHQPRKTDDTPDGPVLLNYYPRVIEDDEFNLARAGQQGRRNGAVQTRDRQRVNVFQSLLVSALDGEGFFLHNQGTTARPKLQLVNYASRAGRARTQTFPYDVFEEAILSQLAEVNPEDVLPRQEAEKPSAIEVLRARLKNIRADIAGLKADLRGGYSKHLTDVLREKETEEERIAGELQDELAKSVRPAEKAWEGVPKLVDLVRKEGDEARLRLRPVLRSIVEEARLLLVNRVRRLIAAVQFHFVGGAHRDYLVVYQSAGNCRRRAGWCCSLADAATLGPRDLRKADDARKMEVLLSAIDLKTLTAAMRELPGLNVGAAEA